MQTTQPIQKRTLATRARLIAASDEIIRSKSYGAMRVEEVVRRAGVAKGTFFAHFRDKDALMDLIIGARIDACLDDMDMHAAPADLDELIARLMPLVRFMICERYVFDVIVRHSGAAAKEEIGVIAQTFTRQVEVMGTWLTDGPFRKDVPAHVLAEGVQAFIVQSIALHFCASQPGPPISERLKTYLDAWLKPGHTGL